VAHQLDLEQEKIAPSFWSKASLTTFLPEALIQTLISLPVAAVMRSTAVRLVGWNWLDTLAIGLFSAGFSLEVLADSQKAQAKKIGVKGMYREGVWSLVRHPK
jgi:steroid 5-alpha reductase family enzyme